MKTHYFVTCPLGFIATEDKEEGMQQVAQRFIDKKWLSNCLKDGIPGVMVWVYKVNAPVEENYKIEWYRPVGVEVLESEQFYCTHIAKAGAKFYSFTKEFDEVTKQIEDNKE